MNALTFHSTRFKIVRRHGQPWLTSQQLAEALGYSDQSAVTRIYSRRSEEFSDAMTGSVKLTDRHANGKLQEVRVFSLRGAHLIAMFARTPVAKEFRRWVLDILDREVGAGTAPKRYHFPLALADPHDRKFGTAWLTARVLTDPKNATPELDLIRALERDGHDVMGAKVRIIALRDAVTHYANLLNHSHRLIHNMEIMARDMKSAATPFGKNVLFSRKPDPNSAIERHVYGDQLPAAR
ncbi:MAG: Bro-N domain-containing protein [Burkholderiales bacterium]|nr:Bro-N domain-containing protein [Burkholderiales bacterium]